MQSFGESLRKLYKKSPVIAYDICAIPIAWFLSYWLRYNLSWQPAIFLQTTSWVSLSIILVCQIGAYYRCKVYRGLWQFSSMKDIERIVKAVFWAIALALPILYLSSLLRFIPRSILPLYILIVLMLLGGARFLMRMYRDTTVFGFKKTKGQKILIIGAGCAGESLLRDLKRGRDYQPLGFLDDKPSKFGTEIHGVSVLGATDDLPKIVASLQIELIFIAIPSARSKDMRRIVSLCELSHIPFRTLPSLDALAQGLVQVHALREVKLEDLLGREPIKLDWHEISTHIRAKRVLVTGAGGSIGAELCRQIAALRPSQLLILDNCEFNLYSIAQELSRNFKHLLIDMALISITDKVAVRAHFKRFKPHLIFHAAAFKHVPMLECHIRAAVKNNVLGTQIMADAAAQMDVQKFVLISTDKAVNPTNIMGTTKRVAEIYCQNLNTRVKTEFITVRFGNVLGSAGSVVPLFKQQLQQGGPLTVTHPDIERYFMTIPEACQLILQAMSCGQGGEIYVLDMGEPVKIRYLAEQIIRLAGKVPDKDIAIEYTGLRAGEKLFEELFHQAEKLTKTDCEKLFKAHYRGLDWLALWQTMCLLEKACIKHQDDELLILLQSLVPESALTLKPVCD